MKLEFDFSELINFGEKLVNTYDDAVKEALTKVAKKVLRELTTMTPVDTGELRGGWNNADNMAFRVQPTQKGFLVELTNDVEYASDVNYGHYSHNQFGGPYLVKNRTIKTDQSSVYGRNAGLKKKNKDFFVYGHFFVEKAILNMERGKAIDTIVGKCLRAWYKGCAN